MGRQIIANASVRWASVLGRGSRGGAEPWGGEHLNQVQRRVLGQTCLERWKKACVRWDRSVDGAQRQDYWGGSP